MHRYNYMHYDYVSVYTALSADMISADYVELVIHMQRVQQEVIC